jgi:DNA-binding transcriptional ArsR family regulator
MSSPFEPKERKAVGGVGDESLELSTRRWIWENIQRFPGIHFRELERKTALAHGALEYHLGVLEKAGVINAEKVAANIRYFPAEVPQDDQKTLGVLRQEIARRILVSLLERPSLGNQDLARILKKSPSTVSFHLNKLEENGLINRVIESGDLRYRIVEKDRVIRLLVVYRSSFLDRLVDRFVTSWEAETLYKVGAQPKTTPSDAGRGDCSRSSSYSKSPSPNNLTVIFSLLGYYGEAVKFLKKMVMTGFSGRILRNLEMSFAR